MKKVWLNKTNSFQKAEEFDDQYNLSLSPEERLSAVQLLREEYFKINKDLKNENRKACLLTGRDYEEFLRLLNKSKSE